MQDFFGLTHKYVKRGAPIIALLSILAVKFQTPAYAQSSTATAAKGIAALPPGWTATPPVIYRKCTPAELLPLVTGAAAPAVSTEASPPYFPQQVTGAYNLGSAIPMANQTGAGETVAIVDAYGDFYNTGSGLVDYAQSDLQTFSNEWGLPYDSSTMTEAFPDGQPTTNNEGWATETTLDIEWVHSIAPDAHILLVVATNSGGSLYDGVTYAKNNAHIVSMSWEGGEFSSESSYDSTYFPASDTAFFVSTGDGGSAGGVGYPSASPGVTAIGGTSLYLDNGDANGDPPYTYSSESGWSGSTGGPSVYEPRPSFQTLQSSSKREVPDISAIADPNTGVYVYKQGDWYAVGGTSLACPFWAGVTALIDGNLSIPITESELQKELYSDGSSDLDYYFHDITSGNNGGYSCGTGYDLVTGIGSPVGNIIIPQIADSQLSPTLLTLNAPVGLQGSTVTLSTTLIERNGEQLPIPYELIDFYVNNVFVGSAYENSNAVASLNYTIPATAPTGFIEISALFGGDGYNASDTAENVLTVQSDAPSISSFSPSSGPIGTTITIQGSNLTNATSVKFAGGVTATPTPNQFEPSVLDVTVPTGAETGTFTVTNPSGKATSPSAFTVTPPQATTLTVASVTGSVGSTVNLTATLTAVSNQSNFQTIGFYVNGTYVGSASTEGDPDTATLPYVVTSGTGAWSQSIKATYAGSNANEPSSGTGTLAATSIPTTITVTTSPTSATAGQTVTITATLASTTGSLDLPNRDVNFYVDGTKIGAANTNSSGVATETFTVPSSDSLGSHSVEGIFEGDSHYSDSAEVAYFTVVGVQATSLTVASATGEEGTTIPLSATLTTKTGSQPVSGVTLDFAVNGTNVGTGVTNTSGVATYNYFATTGPGAWSQTITVTFPATSAYLASSGAGSLALTAIPTSIAETITPSTAKIGQSVVISATLTPTGTAYPLPNRSLDFYVDGAYIGYGTTNSNGVATETYTVPSGDKAGAHTVSITFAGDSHYAKSTQTGTLNVTTGPQATTLTVTATTGPVGTSIPLTATLTTTTGTVPVSGATLSFSVNGAAVGTAVTNTSGVATVNYTVTAGSGSWSQTISVSFAATASDLASSGTATLAATNIPTTLTVSCSPTSPAVGATVVITATLKTTTGAVALSNRGINFYVDTPRIGVANTTTSGVATEDYTAVAGTHTVMVTFTGDSHYKASSATTSLTVP